MPILRKTSPGSSDSDSLEQYIKPLFEKIENKTECFQPTASDVLRSEYVQEIVKTATNKFQKNDTDGNGYLGEDELRSAATNLRSGEERERWLALQTKVSEVAALSNDQWGPEWSGISLKDLAELNQVAKSMPKAMASANAIRDVGLTNWSQMMSGGSDRIYPKDFDAVFGRVKSASSCDWQALHAMQERYNEIRHGRRHGTSITYNDLDSYPAKVKGKFGLIFDL